MWKTLWQWKFEVSCLIGSTLVLVGTVVFLNAFDHRPLPTLPAALSLNSIMAVLTVMAKGCFTVPLVECLSQWKWNWFHQPRAFDHFDDFDQASRGLWGSAVLVWKLRFRHVATFGAFVYIVSVTTGLFTQQSIAYVPGVIQVGTPRSSSVREIYHWGLDEMGASGGALAVDAAIMSSLFDNGIAAVDVVPKCFSDNCTYPEFTTLSVCSQVVDITPSLTKREVTNVTNYPWTFLSDDQALLLGSIPTRGGGDGQQPSPIRNATNGLELSLPNGFAASIPELNVLYLTPMNASVAFRAETDDRYRAGLVSMVALFYAPFRGKRLQVSAYEILFHMCVNTYNASVSSSVASSSIKSSYSTPIQGSAGANRPLSCGTSNTTCHASRNTTRDSHITFHTTGRVYSIDSFTAEYMGTSLARYLSGWRASTFMGETMISGFLAYKVLKEFGDDPNLNPRPPLELMVKRAAAGLNRVIQSSAWGNSLQLPGQAWSPTVFVRIRWAWLALLAAEMGLAMVFLGYTVWATQRMGIEPFKSSSMATLLALDQSSRVAVERTVSNREEKRKQQEVQLRLRDRRLVLDGEGREMELRGQG